MHIEDEDLLKAWIARDVEPLTDADADALAKYVIALIKKPLSDAELEKLCLDKLDVFLQSNTESFVSRLFRCLKGGLYLPEAATSRNAPPPSKDHNNEDQIILSGGESEQEEEEEVEAKSAEVAQEKGVKDQGKAKAKEEPRRQQAQESTKPTATANSASARTQRRRISPPASSRPKEETKEEAKDQPTRTYGSNRRPSPPRGGAHDQRGRRAVGGVSREVRSGRTERYHRRQRSWSRSKSRSRSPRERREKREEHEPIPRRQRCRDFHEKGFCMRGDKCLFDHGPDPVVIENSALEKFVGRTGTATGISSSSPGYNPHALNPPPPGVDNKVLYGASPTAEAYNPEAPGLNPAAPNPVAKMDFSVPPPPIPGLHYQPPPFNPQLSAASSGLVTVIGGAGAGPPTFNSNLVGVQQHQDPMAGNFNSSFYNSAGGHAPFRRGIRGVGRFRPYGMGTRINPALCSLLVKKIPPEQNKIVMLDQHFGKFGVITNLHVQFDGQPDTALVTFKSRREAMNAYKSTEPIFNNRFIKVFWQTQPDLPAGDSSTADEAAGQQASTGQPAATLVPVPPTDLNRAFSKTFGAHEEQEQVTEPAAKTGSESQVYDPSLLEAGIPQNPPPAAGIQTHLKRPVYNPRAVAAKRRADKENLMKMVDLHRRKTELYTKQMEQQKDLLIKIQATDNQEIKKKYMELVKKTSQATRTAKAEIEKLGGQITEMQRKQNAEAAKKPGVGVARAEGAATTNGNDQLGSSTNGEEKEGTNEKSAVAPSTHASPHQLNYSTNKKLFRVVLVSGCPVESNEELIVHMEKFGELFDFDIAPRNRASPFVFTYKNPADAQRAVAEASNFPQLPSAKLKVEWAPVSLGQQRVVVPDGERKPDEQVTPAALLAALEGDDYEEDDEEEEARNSGNNDEEEAEELEL